VAFLRSATLAVIFFAGILVTGSAANGAVKTLYVSLPGPLDACSSISGSVTDNSFAIGDLLYPSAFLNDPHDQLVGTGAGIVSAELTSVAPETVTYTVGPNLRWSNGERFTAASLIQWWTRARFQPTVFSDGYRNISTMTPSPNGLSVVATFSQPVSNWPLLFRDVLTMKSPLDCRLKNLLSRPTLGYYSVASISKHQIILKKSFLLHKGGMRFGRIVISDLVPSVKGFARNFVGESTVVDPQTLSLISAHQELQTSVLPSAVLTQMGFSPMRSTVGTVAIRQALSISVNRQLMANAIWGSSAQNQVIAKRLLSFSFLQQNETTLDVPADCLTCALDALKSAGYSQSGSGWRTSKGVVLAIRMTVGPASSDRAAANFIINTWRVIGIPVFRVPVATEELAAASLRHASADVAIYTRSLAFGSNVAARAYFGGPFENSYSLGLREPALGATASAASQNFNAGAAAQQWAQVDFDVSTSYFSRALFNPPVIQAWSHRFISMKGASSVISLVDQLPSLRP
jgi:ABC-type transport system substrate-binding protein